ncbi:MAG TPA: glycosyltransferase family 4 protein [Silvibacterium sp.]|nr:glycosyltransferase family 4 protein [Silvibacterium sp.]
MPKVLIIQAEVKHYRIPFFTGLHAALERDGIQLKVAYSNRDPQQPTRKGLVDLPPSVGMNVKGHWFLHRFLYQSLWKEIFRADLVITGSELKFIINPFLMLLCALRLKRVAFWGLGPNRHPTRSELAERIKRPLFTSVDWYFAYTESIARYLHEEGMPKERITNVQNATDSTKLRKLIEGIPDAEVSDARIALTGSAESKVGLYCGMLDKIKSIPTLIETARLVKQKCPDFHLVIIGNGPEREWLEGAIADEPWIHYLGSKFGRDSALYYKMADVSILAGTAGLAVVDSFAAQLPLLVTDLPTHPPEISYVIDGENGRVAPHDPEAFSTTIAETLSNPETMERLRRGAKASSKRYTMETMIENYRTGIKKCLALSGRSPVSNVAEFPAPETASR